MNVFDIVGPVMIGPSSSHTAGAARAGLIALRLLGAVPCRAEITLYGSFAETYVGHGTDRALVGGLLGLEIDDTRLRDSLALAAKRGLCVSFSVSQEAVPHPNTVRILLFADDGHCADVTICSVGGGAVRVVNINGARVDFSAEYDTTVIFNPDRPGMIAGVTALFAAHGVNIAFMRVFRKQEGKEAIMVIESDQHIDAALIQALRETGGVERVITIPPFRG